MHSVVAERTNENDVIDRVFSTVATIDNMMTVWLTREIEGNRSALTDTAGRTISCTDVLHDL